RLLRLPDQPLQPRPDRVPRRRPADAGGQVPGPRRRQEQSRGDDGALRRPRGAPGRRHDRLPRGPAPPVRRDDDRAILERVDADLEQHVATIADEFRHGFEAVDAIGRPAVTVYGSARINDGDAAYERA